MSQRYEKTTQETNNLDDIIYLVRHQLQLNRFIQKPKLSMRTQYQHNFTNHSVRKEKIKNYDQPIIRPQSVAPFRTQYNENYQSRASQKHYFTKKQSPVESDSPFLGTTTYGTNFIGHRGANQYVKVKNQGVKNNIKFNDRTTYKQTFTNKQQSTQRLTKTQIKPQMSSRSSNTENNIRRKTTRSSYEMDFESSKYKDFVNPENKAHDYSSFLLFAAPTKQKLRMKTSYEDGIHHQQKNENSKLRKHQKLLKYKKSDFKRYQLNQIAELKKKLKRTLG